MILISIYLIINEVDHLFTYLLAIPIIIFFKEMSVFNSVIFCVVCFYVWLVLFLIVCLLETEPHYVVLVSPELPV